MSFRTRVRFPPGPLLRPYSRIFLDTAFLYQKIKFLCYYERRLKNRFILRKEFFKVYEEEMEKFTACMPDGGLYGHRCWL